MTCQPLVVQGSKNSLIILGQSICSNHVLRANGSSDMRLYDKLKLSRLPSYTKGNSRYKVFIFQRIKEDQSDRHTMS